MKSTVQAKITDSIVQTAGILRILLFSYDWRDIPNIKQMDHKAPETRNPRFLHGYAQVSKNLCIRRIAFSFRENS